MTAGPRSVPARAMSRLATWADYGLAIALMLCRRLRLPERSEARVLASAYGLEPVYAVEPCGWAAHSGGTVVGPAPRWREPAVKQPWFVRPAEVVMLTLSLFLAAHLVGGGTPGARAPQVGLVAVLAGRAPAPARVIEVWPSIPGGAPVATPEAVAAAAEGGQAVPAPTSHGDAAASSLPAGSAAAAPSAEPARSEPTSEAPAPIASPAAQLAPLTYAQVTAFAIEAGWPAELADAVARVAWCESRFRPDAVGYGTYGLMQVVPLWFEYAGIGFDQWADPVANLRAALAAFRYSEEKGHSAWSAWSCKPEAIVFP